MNKLFLSTMPALASAVLLAGCGTLEPDLPQADAQVPVQWPMPENAAPSARDWGGAEQAADIGWRDFFTDQNLEQLISLALENNRDLRVAVLNVERARAQYRIQRADRLPWVNGNGSITRSGGDSAPEVEEYRAELGLASFEVDLFGRVKHLSDAALRSYFATEAGARSTQLSLIAEVANAYLALAADMERQQIAQATVENYQEALGIAEKRLELGTASSLDVSQARTILANARSDTALYRGLVATDTNALALLLGAPVPADLIPHSFTSDVSGLAQLPLGMPSEVLLRRPDIQQAEETLRAANANVGAARAAFFPSITLTGAVGTASDQLSDLFGDNSGVWSFVPRVSIPIFQGGRLRANRAVAEADRQIALASYEQAIQAGFRDVADALALSWSLADQRRALQDMVASASEYVRLSQARYESGRVDYLSVLDAQRSLYSARQALVAVLLQEQANRVTLYRVLGGGWKAQS